MAPWPRGAAAGLVSVPLVDITRGAVLVLWALAMAFAGFAGWRQGRWIHALKFVGLAYFGVLIGFALALVFVALVLGVAG